MRPGIVLLVLILLLLGSVVSVFAQGEGPSANEVNAIAKNIYCPVCENVPLDACGTAACVQWRQQIADKLALGWTEGQIYDFFVEQYGDRVLSTPPLRGLNWLIYVLPPVAFLIGGVLLYRNLKNWRSTEKSIPKAPKTEKGNYVQQLEEELRARR